MNKTKYDPDYIAPYHPFANQEKGYIEEYLTDTGVIFTQGLQNTDHVRPLQDNNQQSRNHGEASNSKDQYQNHHHINILHLQPVEYHRIQFFDGAGIVCVTIPVLLLSNIKIQIFSNPVQVVIIIHLQFQTAHLVRRPTIQAAYLADISYHKQLVIINKTRLINTRYTEFTSTHFVLHKISQKGISNFQPQQISQITGEQHIRRHLIGRKDKQLTLFQIITEESPIIVPAYTFQHDPLEITVGFQDSRLRGKTFHMRNAGKGFQMLQERIAHCNWSRFVRSIIIKVRDLDM